MFYVWPSPWFTLICSRVSSGWEPTRHPRMHSPLGRHCPCHLTGPLCPPKKIRRIGILQLPSLLHSLLQAAGMEAPHMSNLPGTQISLREPWSCLFFPNQFHPWNCVSDAVPQSSIGKSMRWKQSCCSKNSWLCIIINCQRKFSNEVLTEETSDEINQRLHSKHNVTGCLFETEPKIFVVIF